jgi:hypothetical protein
MIDSSSGRVSLAISFNIDKSVWYHLCGMNDGQPITLDDQMIAFTPPLHRLHLFRDREDVGPFHFVQGLLGFPAYFSIGVFGGFC